MHQRTEHIGVCDMGSIFDHCLTDGRFARVPNVRSGGPLTGGNEIADRTIVAQKLA